MTTPTLQALITAQAAADRAYANAVAVRDAAQTQVDYLHGVALAAKQAVNDAVAAVKAAA